MRAEVWRPIYGYEGVYEVSDCGSIKRVATGQGSRLGRLLRLAAHAQGYLTVGLWRQNKGRGFLVHRLVAEAFLRPLGTGEEINHRNGAKTDNRVENLEIVRRQENIDHAVRTGLIANKGENNAQVKLNEAQVNAIRAAYRRGGYQVGGKGYKALAQDFGVSWGTIRDIIRRRIWAHLPAAPSGVS